MARTTRSSRGGRKKPRPKRRPRLPAAAWFVLAGVLLLTGVGYLKFRVAEDGGGRAGDDALEVALGDVLPDYPAGPARRPGDRDLAPALDGAGRPVRCRVVKVAAGRDWRDVVVAVDAAARRADRRVLRSGADGPARDASGRFWRLDLGAADRVSHTLLLHREPSPPSVTWRWDDGEARWEELVRGRGPVLAIVIDDWGYGDNETTDRILALDVPLTMAILPGLAYSQRFAAEATELLVPSGGGGDRPVAIDWPGEGPNRSRRRETILHWPMQPASADPVELGPWGVEVGMDRETIDERLTGALRFLPSVSGVNNHMGSAATTDAETMGKVVAVLAERGMFFFDSLTTAESVAWETARAAGVPALRNQGFLDPGPTDEVEVRRQLHRLVRLAEKTGFAVGIGHPKGITAEVLSVEIPRLCAAGVRFVTVSEMIALRAAAERPNS